MAANWVRDGESIVRLDSQGRPVLRLAPAELSDTVHVRPAEPEAYAEEPLRVTPTDPDDDVRGAMAAAAMAVVALITFGLGLIVGLLTVWL